MGDAGDLQSPAFFMWLLRYLRLKPELMKATEGIARDPAIFDVAQGQAGRRVLAWAGFNRSQCFP